MDFFVCDQENFDKYHQENFKLTSFILMSEYYNVRWTPNNLLCLQMKQKFYSWEDIFKINNFDKNLSKLLGLYASVNSKYSGDIIYYHDCKLEIGFMNPYGHYCTEIIETEKSKPSSLPTNENINYEFYHYEGYLYDIETINFDFIVVTENILKQSKIEIDNQYWEYLENGTIGPNDLLINIENKIEHAIEYFLYILNNRHINI